MHAVLANIDFHAGRPWPLDVALWDLAGQIQDQPVWSLVGGRDHRVRTYASSGVHRPIADMVVVARQALALGFPALKVRFGRPSLDADLAVVRAVRDDVGGALELMVDCNQGWRMPWDTRPPWDVDRATEVALALDAERITWMEEPLHRGDYAGLVELRRRVDVPIAGAELTREAYELRELLTRGCLDVFQPDCVCTQGITGLARFAAGGRRRRRRLHAPHLGQRDRPAGQRPPDGRDRRRAVPRVPVRPAGVDDGPPGLRAGRAGRGRRGRLAHLSDRPGLGCRLDEEALARTATSARSWS